MHFSSVFKSKYFWYIFSTRVRSDLYYIYEDYKILLICSSKKKTTKYSFFSGDNDREQKGNWQTGGTAEIHEVYSPPSYFNTSPHASITFSFFCLPNTMILLSYNPTLLASIFF